MKSCKAFFSNKHSNDKAEKFRSNHRSDRIFSWHKQISRGRPTHNFPGKILTRNWDSLGVIETSGTYLTLILIITKHIFRNYKNRPLHQRYTTGNQTFDGIVVICEWLENLLQNIKIRGVNKDGSGPRLVNVTF